MRRPTLTAPSARAIFLILPLLTFSLPARADQTLVLDGEVPGGSPDHVLIPFEVPAGTAEIEVHHEGLDADSILDWGLNDPSGFRGWGGGNVEPAIVGELSASRSYLAGPITPGTWSVVIGKAKLKTIPAPYKLTVLLRDAATLPPQAERAPYAPSAALEKGPRWYAGDFHVHSVESGDAQPPLDEIADFARAKGLDFVEISDHNTTSHLDFFVDAQGRHPDVLFLPGVEYTTYAGHANGIGATSWVDHKIGLGGVTIEGAAKAFADQDALFAINHPVLDLGDVCIGCAWDHALDASAIGAVEIATGGWSQTGIFFAEQSIVFWNKLCASGAHIAAIGGSDDHKAGKDIGSFQSPIGDPTTMVFADELSAPAIVAAVRAGRTVVKMQGPDDPMIDLNSSAPLSGDTVAAARATFIAKVSGGVGHAIRFVHNGTWLDEVAITADPFTFEMTLDAPLTGEDRVRAEVLVDGKPRTITSHLWLKTGPGGLLPPVTNAMESGCGCSAPGALGVERWLLLAFFPLAGAAAARRLRPRR